MPLRKSAPLDRHQELFEQFRNSKAEQITLLNARRVTDIIVERRRLPPPHTDWDYFYEQGTGRRVWFNKRTRRRVIFDPKNT